MDPRNMGRQNRHIEFEVWTTELTRTLILAMYPFWENGKVSEGTFISDTWREIWLNVVPSVPAPEVLTAIHCRVKFNRLKLQFKLTKAEKEKNDTWIIEPTTGDLVVPEHFDVESNKMKPKEIKFICYEQFDEMFGWECDQD